jgi:hypothetical protein
MRQMTHEETQLAAELFKVGDRPPPHTGELRTHLTVRFDPALPGVVYYGPHLRERKVRIPGAVVLSYMLDTSARTPTGGRFARQSLLIRTSDGRKWQGNPKPGTDVVVLKIKKEKGKK